VWMSGRITGLQERVANVAEASDRAFAVSDTYLSFDDRQGLSHAAEGACTEH